MTYKVIDNFLDEEYFNSLVVLCVDGSEQKSPTLPWYYQPNVTHLEDYNNRIVGNTAFYMIHMFYQNSIPVSAFFDTTTPLLEKLGVRGLLRVKANLYPNTKILHEHQMHVDYDFSHSSAILSLNTCDGYTKLKDGTKIDSVANRILLFDGGEEHCSSTTTNTPARFNINLNYVSEQYLKKGYYDIKD